MLNGGEKRRKKKKEEELKRKRENGGGAGYGGITERRERIRQSKYSNWYKWITEEGLIKSRWKSVAIFRLENGQRGGLREKEEVLGGRGKEI